MNEERGLRHQFRTLTSPSETGQALAPGPPVMNRCSACQAPPQPAKLAPEDATIQRDVPETLTTVAPSLRPESM